MKMGERSTQMGGTVWLPSKTAAPASSKLSNQVCAELTPGQASWLPQRL